MPLNATQRTPGRLRPFHVLLVQMAVDARWATGLDSENICD